MTGMEHLTVASFSGDPAGWIIAIAGTLLTLWTIWFAIVATIAPGETDPNHPKFLILKHDR